MVINMSDRMPKKGITLDVFYNTLGLHSFTIVFLAYLRGYFIRLLAPKMMDDLSNVNSVAQFGFQRVVVYTLILVFIHHIFLFFIMAGGTDFILNTFLKVLISTLVSTLIIISFQRIFFNKI